MKRLRRLLKLGVCIMIGAFALPILGPVFLAPVREPAHAAQTMSGSNGDARFFTDQEVEARVYTGKDGVTAEIVHVGKGVFEKIGDGWRKGKWEPRIPTVRPKTIDEVLNPFCIGRPQECREEAQQKPQPQQQATTQPKASYTASVEWQCRDPRTVGNNYAPKSWDFTSSVSQADANAQAQDAVNSGKDLCKAYDPMKITDREMVPGSAHVVGQT